MFGFWSNTDQRELEKLRILESMEGLKSHRHHLPSNPSGADVVLITTFLLLDSFRPFK